MNVMKKFLTNYQLVIKKYKTGIKYTTLWHRIKSKNKKFKNYQYV